MAVSLYKFHQFRLSMENQQFEKALLEIALEESAEMAKRKEVVTKTEKKTDAKVVSLKPRRIVITEDDLEDIDGLLFSDGTFASHTSVFERLPNYYETFANGGLCFLVALFMENIEYFAKRKIVSPYALQKFLETKTDINFGTNSMLEGDDIAKISRALSVSITVRNTNTGGIEIEKQVFGGGEKLNAVQLDWMDMMGGGHFVVNM